MIDTNYFINGCISGSIGVIASHPIDTIKTCVQKGYGWKYNTLYKGMLSPLYGVGLEKAIVFGVYNNLNNNLNYNKYINTIISGGVSGFCASIIVTPIEKYKILKQLGQYEKIKLNMYFKGINATFTREIPGFSIYFTTYEFLKSNYPNTYLNCFLFGSISGLLSWIFIYPQDRIKTLMQTTDLSFINAFNKIYKEKGITSFYSGFKYAALRAIILHGTAFFVMENLNHHTSL
jgi:hypothetical protein